MCIRDRSCSLFQNILDPNIYTFPVTFELYETEVLVSQILLTSKVLYFWRIICLPLSVCLSLSVMRVHTHTILTRPVDIYSFFVLWSIQLLKIWIVGDRHKKRQHLGTDNCTSHAIISEHIKHIFCFFFCTENCWTFCAKFWKLFHIQH